MDLRVKLKHGLVLLATIGASSCFQNSVIRGSAPSTPKDSANKYPSPSPMLTITQTAYTFPKVSGNEPYTATLTNGSLEKASELTITRNFSSDAFSVLSDNCGSYIPAGASCSMSINYANTLAVAQTGYITVNYKDKNGVAQVPLLLSFFGPAAAAATPPSSGGGNPPVPSPTTPPVTGPAVISATYTTQKSNVSCGTITLQDVCNYPTPSTFDGVNCFVGGAPSWTTRVWYDALYKGFYFNARSGTSDVCGGVGTFDGVNCKFSGAYGKDPWADSRLKGFYFKPSTRQVNAVWQGDCPEGSSFDGNSCYYGTAPTAPGTVESRSCPFASNCTGGVFSFPPSGGNSPCGSLWYDQGTGKCQLATVPTGVQGWVWQNVNFYLQQKNVTCVAR